MSASHTLPQPQPGTESHVGLEVDLTSASLLKETPEPNYAAPLLLSATLNTASWRQQAPFTISTALSTDNSIYLPFVPLSPYQPRTPELMVRHGFSLSNIPSAPRVLPFNVSPTVRSDHTNSRLKQHSTPRPSYQDFLNDTVITSSSRSRLTPPPRPANLECKKLD